MYMWKSFKTCFFKKEKESVRNRKTQISSVTALHWSLNQIHTNLLAKISYKSTCKKVLKLLSFNRKWVKERPYLALSQRW